MIFVIGYGTIEIRENVPLTICWASSGTMNKGVSDLERDTYQRGTDAARVIQVIETKAVRGSGEKNQPFRTVIEYWSFDGKKLGEIDPLISAAE